MRKERTINVHSRRPGGIAIAVAAALLLGAVLYFAGSWQARGEAGSVRLEFERQLSDAQTQLQQAQERLAAAEDRNHLLLALGTLYQAVIDLDQRNFGVANTHLREAGTALRSVSATTGVVDTERLGTLQRAIEGTDLNVAINLQAHRARVLEFAAQLQALVPRHEPLAPNAR